MTHDQEPLTAKIPSDVEQPDKIIYGLTAQQVAVLAAAGLLASFIYLAVDGWLPLPVVVALVLPVLAAGLVVAVARRDGMGLDRFLLTGLMHLTAPKTRVRAPEGVAAPPGWCRMRVEVPAPLRLPVRAVRDDGVLELSGGGTAVLIRAGTVPFGLRTAAEQAALVAAFGRWLNSLDAPTQILVRSHPVELTGLADQVAKTAPHLPDPALERAAHDHAAFLAELTASRELLTRQVVIVVRDHAHQQQAAGRPPWARARPAARDSGAAVVLRRAEEAVRSLAALGIAARVLDAADCAAVLTESLSPGETPLAGLAAPHELITAAEVQR